MRTICTASSGFQFPASELYQEFLLEELLEEAYFVLGAFDWAAAGWHGLQQNVQRAWI